MKTLLILLLTLFSWIGMQAQAVLSIRERQQTIPAGTQWLRQAKMAAVNSCDTWTFQQQLSSAAGERPTDVVQLPGNQYIVGGSDSAGTTVRARLIKLSAEGTVLQSKAYALPGKEVTVERLRLFSDGKLYVLANAWDPSVRQIMPLLFSVDTATLSLLSVLKFENTTWSPVWQGVDFGEGRGLQAYVLVSNSYLLNVTRIDLASNSMRWSQTYQTQLFSYPVGIGVEYGDVYIAWNEMDYGRSKGMIMSLHPETGTLQYGTSTGGGADGVDIELQSISMVNLRPRFTALRRIGYNIQAVRLNYETTATPNFTEVFTLGGFSPEADMQSRQDQWGQTMAFQSAAAANQIHLLHTYPDNRQTPVRSWQVNYAQPVSLKRVIVTNDGGNMVISRTTNFPEKIVLTKTDSAANMPGCSTAAQPASFEITLPSQEKITLQEQASGMYLYTFALTETDVPVTTNVECKTLFCPSPPEPDSCLRTFFKEYRNSSNSIVTGETVAIGGGKFLQHGYARGMPYDATEQTQLTILDTAGKLLDSRMLVSAQPVVLFTLTKLKDGNLLGTGLLRNGNLFSDIYLFKFSPQFSILWQKKLVTGAAPHFNSIGAVLESSEGDLYCYLIDRVTAPQETRTMLKLTAAGEPVWMRQYAIGPTVFAQSAEFIPALVEVDNAIIVKYNDEDSDYSPYLMRLQKEDGIPVWVRKYQMPGPFGGSGSFSLRAMIADDSYVYLSGISQERNVLLKIRPDGSVALARRSPATSVNIGWMGFAPGGRLRSSVGMTTMGGYVNGVAEMDKDFTLLRTQYMQVPRGGRNRTLLPFSDSVTYAAGSLWYDNHYWASAYFQKYNFNSSFASCAVTEPLLTLESFTQPVTTKQVATVSLTLPQMVPSQTYFTTGHLAYSGYHCGNSSSCISLDLQGPDRLCNPLDSYSYRVARNKGCDGNVVWQLDTVAGQVKVLQMSDSLLQIQVHNGGRFMIRAKVFANCSWVTDSIQVQATISNHTLNLGKDTSLCANNTLALRAGPGYGSYRWQDGSTDSVFLARQPGWYWVEVGSCNGVLRDTVLVTAAPPIPFNIGPDRLKCNKDTLHLEAPAGFLNYTWLSPYNMSSHTGSSVVVHPDVDTVYVVKAEKTPGCFAFDTIRVSVFHAPPIQLGPDQTFCAGDKKQLDAGAGFSTYVWNNGATTRQLTVQNAGQYIVTGITYAGCQATDTVVVQNVWPLPVVQLDKRSSLCAGTTRTLTAGNFSNYSWQDGSTGSTFTVSVPGQYNVTVTDLHGCTGSDTVNITTMLPLPADFLPADTAICTYSKLQIKPLQTFTSYRWSTGSQAASITVEKPGLYWLEVQDRNQCTGRDTLVVKTKACMSGVFIPTAITPNRDGKNDEFRALVFGKTERFALTVYNRWGQVIFYTADPTKGWDGKVTGLVQETSVYTWVCMYQLEGENQTMEKGTVTVIR